MFATLALLPAKLYHMGGYHCSPGATSAVAVHRRSRPDRRAEILLLDGSNSALCDTSDPAWRGWNGLPGSGRLRVEIGERLGKLLRDIAAETAPPVQAGR